MHMTIPLKVLQAGLKAIAPATKARTPLPILNHVLIQPGKLTATDCDLSIEHTLSEWETGIYHEPGGCTVDYRTLSDWTGMVKSDTVTMRLDNHELLVSAGKSKTTLPTMPAEEFPRINFAEGTTYHFPDGTLQQVLRKIDVARATAEETRAVMTGTYFCFSELGLELCCTDGRRLAHMTIPGNYPEKQEAVISGADHILGLGDDVTLQIARGGWAAQAGNTRIGGRLLEGSFVDWRRVCQFETPTVVSLPRVALLEALRRVLLFTLEKQCPHLVRMDFEGGVLRISGQTPGSGQAVEELGAPWDGSLSISFSGKFVADGLAIVDTPTIDWGFQDPTRAARIRVGEWNYVVMPVLRREAVPA